MIRQITHGLLARFGQPVVIRRRDGVLLESRAFVQPVLGRGQETPQSTPTPLGMAAERRYRYMGLVRVAEGDRVEALGQRFFVRAAEPVYVGKQCSHWWALLAAEDEEDACQ